MYKPKKFRSGWGAQSRFIGYGYKNSGKGHRSMQGSKPDISGSIPKVAFELSKKLKNNHNGGKLSVQIDDSEKKFVYSAKLSGNSLIIFNYELCKVKTREGIDFSIPKKDCLSCRHDNCGIDGNLSELADYLKNYGNISVKSPLDGVESVSLQKIGKRSVRRESTEELLERKLREKYGY